MTEHFSYDEFMCPCCKKLPTNTSLLDKLLQKLEELRSALGNHPIHINSGYRCKKHNKEVGGKKDSQHLLGAAADIVVPGVAVEKVAMTAEDVGFGGIGRYMTFTHCDVRESKVRWVY